MHQARRQLPICDHCRNGARFPCRDAAGHLDPDRLAIAVKTLANEDPNDPATDDCLWAIDCMDRLVGERPALGLKLIVFALTYLKEPSEIGVLAAGPLQNLVCFHGERMIDEIEREAAHNEKFRLLLSGIWAEFDVKPEIWRRIRTAVADGPWLVRDPRPPQGSRKLDDRN